MKVLSCIIVLIAFAYKTSSESSDELVYGYECQQSKCVKIGLNSENFQNAVSLPVCRLFCGDSLGTVWPKPTGEIKTESYMVHVDLQNIEFKFPAKYKNEPIWDASQKRFFESLENQIPNVKIMKTGGYPLKIQVSISKSDTADNNEPSKFSLDTDESYSLTVSVKDKRVASKITAKSFFGARHGLETLAQIIIYDDIRRELQIIAKAKIKDSPAFKWRGLVLDTSRNFYSPKSIKRTLDAMAMVKLNRFHWHITDSHSFPFEVKSQPDLHKLGAYSSRKVYRHEDISDIVEYGRLRGISVVPEFDAPAHVGEGWQNKNMTACFNAQPWKNFCVEPPCGQLDPTVEALYPTLEDIYREMFKLFSPDVFHMGGDEVSVNCWNSSERIRDWMVAKMGWGLEEKDFINLWNHFQVEALSRVDRVASANINQIPIVLWTSRLTEVPYIDNYLNKSRYIIQVWTTGSDPKITEILKRGFRVIISNYDALYFDCGGPGWVTDGNNWCSPYIGWQKVYDNDLNKLYGDHKSLVLGAEAAIWSEQIDEFTLDYRLWPRASALAERLWSNSTDTWRSAEARMLLHRERLVNNGIGAETLQPEWCLQNQNECPINAYD